MAGRRSQIETHPQRAQIEFALASGVGIDALSRKFDIQRDALYRHKRKMPPQVLAALRYKSSDTDIDLEALRKSESEGILQHLVAVRGLIYSQMDQCQSMADSNGFFRGTSQIHRNLEITGNLLGDLNSGDQHLHLHLTSTPEYVRLRSLLQSALARYPEAAEAVARVLSTVEEPFERMIDVTPDETPTHA